MRNGENNRPALLTKYCLNSVALYFQAIDLDPTDATLFSNRSLCWMCLGQAEHALADGKTSRELKPEWEKAWYREGAALRLLEACIPTTYSNTIFLRKKEQYS